MSRVGYKPIEVPDKVNLSFEGNMVKAKGPKGELQTWIPEGIKYNFENKTLVFSRTSNEKKLRSVHGLTRALTWNIIDGVMNGFSKNLQIQGVGYKAELKGKNLLLALGYSHSILFIPPEGIQFTLPGPNMIQVSGIDKQLVGEVAAKIRRLRPPEPYKGKGIRYEGEYVRHKAGKTAAK